MNILLINQNWFAKEFRELGHNVISFGHQECLDICERRPVINWQDVQQKLAHNFSPDLIIFYDDSAAFNILGLETIQVPTVFYSVDTHHHANFHTQLGLFFSYTFVAQKDYISSFENIGVQARWLPLWASVYLEPQEPKQYDAVFVGTLDQNLNPDRVRFFEELKAICDVEVLTGYFGPYFTKSKIVINQTVKADLNFRVFETMISGAMLLTERISNGLEDLFEDGKELVTYTKGNVEEAAEKIRYYSSNYELSKQIADAGRQKILAKHLAMHRAEQILNTLNQPTRPSDSANLFGLVANFATLGRTAYRAKNYDLAKVFNFEAIRLARLACHGSAAVEGELPMFLLSALLSLKTDLSQQATEEFLDMLIESYPQQLIFKVARIGLAKRHGRKQAAEEYAAQLNPAGAELIVNIAQGFIDNFDSL